MPSTGRSSAIRARSTSSRPCSRELGHRGAGRADAREHGEVGVGDVVDELGAEAAQRDLDRADVPGAVVADGDLHRIPFVDGMPATPGRSAVSQRAADRLERGLGDVVRVAAARLDVDREPPRLREASRRSARPARARARASAPRAAGRRGRRRRGRARRPSARPRRRSARSRGGRRAPRSSASPNASAVSSAVWWSPVSRSPAPSRTRSSPAWKASCSRKWS